MKLIFLSLLKNAILNLEAVYIRLIINLLTIESVFGTVYIIRIAFEKSIAPLASKNST